MGRKINIFTSQEMIIGDDESRNCSSASSSFLIQKYLQQFVHTCYPHHYKFKNSTAPEVY